MQAAISATAQNIKAFMEASGSMRGLVAAHAQAWPVCQHSIEALVLPCIMNMLACMAQTEGMQQ